MAQAHAPASIGNVPSEATSGASLNASTPMSQRAPKGAPESTGPNIDDKGSYLPATYNTNVIREDGTVQTIIRTDR